MSRTYEPKNKDAIGNWSSSPDFDVNASGARALGIISAVAGCNSKSIERRQKDFCRDNGLKYGPDGHFYDPSTRFSANKREVLLHAAKIRSLLANDVRFDKVMQDLGRAGGLIAGGRLEARKFASSWALFLETCGGYEVQG